MPEGHSVHRIARQFERDLVGHRIAASSPQGRFAEGAAEIDGRLLEESTAVGKHLFLRFEDQRFLHVHLGLYGAWDFSGVVSRLFDDAKAGGSIGAPRRRRALRLAETEHETSSELNAFPPPPVGAVRVRLLAEETVADLRGPTACEVLDPVRVQAVLDRLGPDPATDASEGERDRFLTRLGRTATPVGLVLMDQSAVSGVGNVYRAELLFRARLNPHTPGKAVPRETALALWEDWDVLLGEGIRTGMMITRRDLDDEGLVFARRSRADRNYVYKREGLPCLVCGTGIALEEMGARKLYWCPYCQA